VERFAQAALETCHLAANTVHLSKGAAREQQSAAFRDKEFLFHSAETKKPWRVF